MSIKLGIEVEVNIEINSHPWGLESRVHYIHGDYFRLIVLSTD